MIKILVAGAIALFAASTIAPAPADAASRGRSAKAKAAKAGAVRVARRPASVGQNGLCQRDTGTPDSQLDFKNRCDVEEYWARTMDRGTSADR
jgi:hypothetical protein